MMEKKPYLFVVFNSQKRAIFQMCLNFEGGVKNKEDLNFF